MKADRFARLKEILLQAADLSKVERRQYVDEACRDDPELRREVESMLAHESDPTRIVPTDPSGSSARLDSHPDRIGPYKILEPIGEGGMGVVYLAEQTEPVRRRVALKVIKLGMDTKQVVARFEAERQALAMMDHPSIAKVLDAGATPDGRPYFVMEHVHGVPITDYCDRHELKMPERLELFTQICEAVQHAHQKGVIHRDLKPSNVLVEVVGDHPVPKVIDFGVAKATSHRLTERTVYTEQGQLIGTPEYMSPEQAEMTSLNVDTRTDIYSLGVLLYELLVGALPFEPETLRKASYAEIQRILREVDPPRPSTRLSSLGAETEVVAKHRRTDRSTLMGQLRGDLDWITMKALEKDRTRRYAAASEFAADIRRFLHDEPVVARPPSAAYRIRKLVARHRGQAIFVGSVIAVLMALGVTLAAFGFMAVLVVILAAFAIIMSVMFGMQRVERLRADRERDRADRERDRAVREAETTAQVTATLEEMLATVDPTKSGRDVTVRETLDQTAKTLGEKFKNQPLVEARLRHTVGKTYRALGVYDEAEEHLQRAVAIRRERLGKENPETLNSMFELAGVYSDQGRYKEAEALQRETMETTHCVLGDEHIQTLASMCELGEVYLRQDRYEEAEALLGKTLEAQLRVLGEEHPNTLRTMTRLASEYLQQGREKEAEALQRTALEIGRRVLGEEHPLTLGNMMNLAEMIRCQGRNEEAEALQRKCLEVQRRVLGQEHPWTLMNMENLASSCSQLGRYDEAETLYVQVLRIQWRVLGEGHPSALGTIHNLTWLYSKQGRRNEAVELAREAVDISRRVRGEEDPTTLEAMNDLAWRYRDQDRYDKAEEVHRKAVEISRRVLGREHPRTLRFVWDLGSAYSKQGRYDEADALMLEALEIARRSLGEENRGTNDLRYNLACNEALWGRRDEAISYLKEALDHGYGGGVFSWILDDPDLASLRDDPEAQAIAEEMKRRKEGTEPATVE